MDYPRVVALAGLATTTALGSSSVPFGVVGIFSHSTAIRLPDCRGAAPTRARAVAIADSVALALAPALTKLPAADTVTVYAAFDSAEVVFATATEVWKAGLLHEELRRALPAVVGRRFLSGGYAVLRDGAPVFGGRRVVAAYGYYCGQEP